MVQHDAHPVVGQEIEAFNPVEPLNGPAQFRLGLLLALCGQSQPEPEVRVAVLFVWLKLKFLHPHAFIAPADPHKVVEGRKLVCFSVVDFGLASEACLVRKDEIVAAVLAVNGQYSGHYAKSKLDVVAGVIQVRLRVEFLQSL